MKKQALLIGMDKYLDAGIHNLRYAVEDARLMGNALENAGFETRFLHDDSGQRVVKATQRVVADLGPQDLFVLYFSGHGVSVRNRHLLLCEEAEHQLLEHGRGGVWVDELKKVTATFGGHRAFILDSCRDALLVRKGATTTMGDVSGLRTLVEDGEGSPAIRPGGLTVLCSCDESDTAQESEALGQGLFSRALLDCLGRATRESTELRLDGALTETLAARMQELAARNALSVTQRPWVRTSGLPPVLVTGSAPAAPPPEPVRPPRRRKRASAVSWWVVVAGEERGPLAGDAVESLIERGELTRASECWREGMTDWEAMGEVAEWRGKLPCEATVRPARGVALPSWVEPVSESRYAPVGRLASGSREALARQKEWVAKGYPLEIRIREVGMRFRLVPPGEFEMGSPQDESGRSENEGPQHRVGIMRPFYVATFPMTQKEWQTVMGDTPSQFRGGNLPVEHVSWNDCQAMLAKLDGLVGAEEVGCQLLSGAEWEYACRAGTTAPTYGNGVAWYGGNSNKKTHPVGELAANAWGLHDMLGNVWEWCEDEWHGDYKGAPADGGAWTGGDGSDRVCRGGGWSNSASCCRAAYRSRWEPSSRGYNLGVRLALSPAVH